LKRPRQRLTSLIRRLPRLTAEPGWKQVLVELLQLLEQIGGRLRLFDLAEKRKIKSLLAGKEPSRPEGAAFHTPTTRDTKVMKRDLEGNRRWTAVAENETQAWRTFEIEPDADDAIAKLRSWIRSPNPRSFLPAHRHSTLDP
jgi:hypothetical protein